MTLYLLTNSTEIENKVENVTHVSIGNNLIYVDFAYGEGLAKHGVRAFGRNEFVAIALEEKNENGEFTRQILSLGNITRYDARFEVVVPEVDPEVEALRAEYSNQ